MRETRVERPMNRFRISEIGERERHAGDGTDMAEV